MGDASPTQKHAAQMEAYLNWKSDRVNYSGTLQRLLYTIQPETVERDRKVLKDVSRLIG